LNHATLEIVQISVEIPLLMITMDEWNFSLPNSFTLISESPAKKQIRSRKKSKAPPPPPGGGGQVPGGVFYLPTEMINGGGGSYLISNGHPPYPMYPSMPQPYILQQRHFLSPSKAEAGKGKKLRLFKTKAESKSAANSPAIQSPPSSELIFPLDRPSSQSQNHHVHQFPIRGTPMRASLDANRLLHARNNNESSNKEHARHNYNQQNNLHHHSQHHNEQQLHNLDHLLRLK